LIESDSVWIKDNLIWETDSSDFIYSGKLFDYSKGTLLFLGKNKQAKIIYSTLFKMPDSDSLSFELTEGGAILDGTWKIIDSHTILIKSKLISSKLVYPVDDKRKNIGNLELDTVNVLNNNKIILNHKIYLAPLKLNLCESNRRLLIAK
jgi:hypothetical protein